MLFIRNIRAFIIHIFPPAALPPFATPLCTEFALALPAFKYHRAFHWGYSLYWPNYLLRQSCRLLPLSRQGYCPTPTCTPLDPPPPPTHTPSIRHPCWHSLNVIFHLVANSRHAPRPLPLFALCMYLFM